MKTRKSSGSDAQFGKKAQTGFLFQFKGSKTEEYKTEEYCMYFPFLNLRKWGKRTAETRRRNCAALPAHCPLYCGLEIGYTVIATNELAV